MSYNNEPDIGLAELLQARIKSFGEDVSIEQGEYNVTFIELHDKALSLVNELRKQPIRKEEPIAILAHRGINHILSQVAITFAGCICVPLDIDLSDDYILKLLLNLGVSTVLSDRKNYSRFPNLRHVIVNHASIATGQDIAFTEVSKNDRGCRCHIMHTSGSGGQPKAVQILADGLINLVFDGFAQIVRGSRVAHTCNVGFDVSLWEIWSVLLLGGTSIVFDRHEFLDPLIFERRLKSDRIDVIWQTTSLLATIAHVCPGIYSYVDTLVTGGEAINVQTVRTILAHGRPRRILNAYGPTELTILTTYHEVSEKDVESGYIPIGKPLQNIDTFVVDENLLPVSNGNIGELLVGGKAVAAGYFGLPKRTSEVFVQAPHLQEGSLYRTGDLVRQTDTGVLYYLGRRDNEVKIRGQRVDLAAIEACLLETELVFCAVALKVTLEQPPGTSILLAYVVPATSQITGATIRAAYVKLGRHLMVPRLQITDGIALNPNGKVDRAKLTNDYIRSLQPAVDELDHCQDNGNDTEKYLRQLWHKLLGFPSNIFSATDNFFSLGGTSLQAAILISSIKQSLGVSIPVAALFDNPTLQGMSDILTHTEDGMALPKENSAEAMPWLQDCKLGRDIEPMGTSYPDWTNEGEGKVFLTGATGFIGAFSLAYLLVLPHVQKVACLVRATDADHALTRILNVLSRYGLAIGPEEMAKLMAIPGDFALPHMGLEEKEYKQLSAWSSVALHLGAHVSFVEPYSRHRQANVIGTLNMIRFANTGRLKALHYTSSISAYGPTGIITGCTEIPKNERPEPHSAAVQYDTGYAQSQFVAESIVWNAVDKGCPITVYRLGYVLGHSETGIMNLDDFISRLVTSSMRSGCYPLLSRHRKDLVPVDFVASAILRISSNPNNVGQAFNLVHPVPDTAIDIPKLFGLINMLSGGISLIGISYSEWLDRLSKATDCPLRALMPLLEEQVWGERSRWEMYQDMPCFLTQNTRRALASVAPELLSCPSITTLLATYCPQWIKAAAM